jgi:stress-induced morphogen
VVCRIHSSTYNGKTYCQRHRWVHYWRLFWGLE